jgi:ABC-type polysaccharide/polyol phosphate export permease
MKGYAAEIWGCRHFWLSLVKMDLQTRYRRSVLGIGWSLLHPIGTTLVLCAVFHEIFHMSIREFVPFLMTGLAWWAFVTGVVSRGCQCFVEAESYIRQHPLPMAIYPLRAVLGAMIHLLIALIVALLLSWCLTGFNNLTTLPLLLPGLALLLIFGWAVAVIAGYVNTIFRDIQHLTDILFQILFYLTPIMYKPEILVETRMGWVLTCNPLAHLLKLIRDPIVGGVGGHFPSWRAYAAATGTVVLVTGIAVMLLGRLQRKVILYL